MRNLTRVDTYYLAAADFNSQNLTLAFMQGSGRFVKTRLTQAEVYQHHTDSLRTILHHDAPLTLSPPTYVDARAPVISISIKDHKRPPEPPHKIMSARPVMRHDKRGPLRANQYMQMILRLLLFFYQGEDTYYPVVTSTWDVQKRTWRAHTIT